MKHLLLLALTLLLPLAAHAQTPVSKETANQYFANCVKGAAPSQQMSKEGQEMMCACTAARMTQFFAMEDMKAMMSADQTIARPAYNKMMVEVYAPCMAEPTRERYLARCAKTNGTNRQVCECAAGKIGNYMKNRGSELFSAILAQNGDIMDPWAALESSDVYNKYLETATRECLK